MQNLPKVAIVYLSYQSEKFLDDVMRAFETISYPKERLAFVVVDNPHPESGLSRQAIEQKILPLSENKIPKVVYLPQEKNTGFCGGNNVGIHWALENGYDYVYLHNQDGFMASDCLQKLVDALELDKTIGCAQSLVMLHPEITRVNTSGNSYHYLGFGFIDHFGAEKNTLRLRAKEKIGYASGASLLMRADLLKQFGPLEEDFFAYHEDIEYSLRLRMAGYTIVCVSEAIFYHKYEFSRSPSKFYYMERNRWALLLMYYRWPTLFLLAPVLAMMAVGLGYFFVRNGWKKELGAVYSYWLHPSSWFLWLKKRKNIQAIRTISDRRFLKTTATAVRFGEKADMNSPLLLYIANPILKVYGFIIKKIIFW